MDEKVWEGVVELLQRGRPPFRVSCSLWRRQDGSGVQWGGQAKLSSDAEDRPQWGRCTVRLPGGRQATAVVSHGARDDGHVLAVLAGEGPPPFGDSSDSDETIVAQEAQQNAVSALVDGIRPGNPAAHRSTPAPGDFERTEALARAFLAAVEARHAVREVEPAQLDGALTRALLRTIDALTERSEAELQGEPGSTPVAVRGSEDLAVLRWVSAALHGSDAPENVRNSIERLSRTLREVSPVTDDDTRRAA